MEIITLATRGQGILQGLLQNSYALRTSTRHVMLATERLAKMHFIFPPFIIARYVVFLCHDKLQNQFFSPT